MKRVFMSVDFLQEIGGSACKTTVPPEEQSNVLEWTVAVERHISGTLKNDPRYRLISVYIQIYIYIIRIFSLPYVEVS